MGCQLTGAEAYQESIHIPLAHVMDNRRVAGHALKALFYVNNFYITLLTVFAMGSS